MVDFVYFILPQIANNYVIIMLIMLRLYVQIYAL